MAKTTPFSIIPYNITKKKGVDLIYINRSQQHFFFTITYMSEKGVDIRNKNLHLFSWYYRVYLKKVQVGILIFPKSRKKQGYYLGFLFKILNFIKNVRVLPWDFN